MAGGTVGEVMASVDERGVAELTLSNEPRRNAITRGMRRCIEDLLRAWDEDRAVRVVVVAGAGGKAFCSGLDLSEEAEVDHEELARDLSQFWTSWQNFSKPVIARVDGHCVGGGVLVALQADIRYCSDHATFSIPAARLALPFSFDSVRPLVATVGAARAAEMVFSARSIDAAEAQRAGLVLRVFDTDALVDATRELAVEIAANAPLTVRAAKVGIRQASRDPSERDLVRLAEIVALARSSRDLREAREARLEGRPPQFDGE